MVASIDVQAADASVQQLLPMEWHQTFTLESYLDMQSLQSFDVDILCKVSWPAAACSADHL